MIRFLLWLSRLYHDLRDANAPRVSLRAEWRLTKQEPGDRT